MRPPNKKKWDEEMDAYSVQIREKEAELEKLKMQGGGSVSGQLKNLKAEKIATIERRKKIDADLEKLNKGIPEKMRQLNSLESSLHYKNEDKINTAIQKLEWNLRAQSFKLSEEKKIVSEIDSLKRSKKTLVQYLALKNEIAGIRDRQRRMREERDTYYRAVSHLKGKEESLRKNSTLAKSSISVLRKEIDTLYEQRRNMVASYRRQCEEFQGAKDKQRKESMKKKEEERRAFMAGKRKKEAELHVEKLPFDRDLHLCNTLINYLTRFNQIPPDNSVDSLSPSSSQDDPEPAEEIGDGQYILLKKADDFEGMDYSGATSRKLTRKNRRSRKQSMVKKITHTPEALSQFLTLSLTPPNTISDVAEALEQLKVKKSFFEKEQHLSEVSSDAGISATESTICEMSRQASKTESCEGGTGDTHPGDQVYADLLKSCQGVKDSVDQSTISGAVGGSTVSEMSESISPNSDSNSTIEGEGYLSQGEGQNLLGDESICRSLSKGTQQPWSRSGVDSAVSSHSVLSTACTQCNDGKLELSLQNDNAQRELHISVSEDSRPLNRSLNQRRVKAQQNLSSAQNSPRGTNGGGCGLSYAGTVIAGRPRSFSEVLPQSQTLGLDHPSVLPVAWPSQRSPSSPRSPGAAPGSASDSTKSTQSIKGTFSAQQSLTREVVQGGDACEKSHQPLSKHYSSPSSIGGQSLTPSLNLDGENFPPLSSSLSRRSSNLSTKSSGGSATPTSVPPTVTDLASLYVCDQPQPSSLENAAWPTSMSHTPPCTKMVASSDISGGEKSQLLSMSQPSIMVAQIPREDKSSTERWVQSSVEFTKGFGSKRHQNEYDDGSASTKL